MSGDYGIMVYYGKESIHGKVSMDGTETFLLIRYNNIHGSPLILLRHRKVHELSDWL